MSIQGPSSLRSRLTSTRTLETLPPSPCRSAHSVLGAHPVRVGAQQREDLGQARAQLDVAVVDLERGAVAAEEAELGQRAGDARDAPRLHGVHDERLERGGDRLGHRGRAGREHERAAAGRDREPADDAPAGRDGADRAAGRRHQRAAVGRDAVAVAGVQARVALLQRELQAGLDGARGRGGDGEAVRVHGATGRR